jgi:hypothetical protein
VLLVEARRRLVVELCLPGRRDVVFAEVLAAARRAGQIDHVSHFGRRGLRAEHNDLGMRREKEGMDATLGEENDATETEK